MTNKIPVPKKDIVGIPYFLSISTRDKLNQEKYEEFSSRDDENNSMFNSNINKESIDNYNFIDNDKIDKICTSMSQSGPRPIRDIFR